MQASEYKVRSQAAFDRQAAQYDQQQWGRHARALYPHMLQRIAHTWGPRVLDLGCGTGALLEQVLAEQPDRKVTGLDLSAGMLEVAARRLGGRAALVQGDSERLPFAARSFDVVYCNDSFHHYPAPEKVLEEVARVLEFGGAFLLGDCWAPQPQRAVLNFFMRWSSEGDVRIYSKKQMRDLLGAQFHGVEWEAVEGSAFVAKGVR